MHAKLFRFPIVSFTHVLQPEPSLTRRRAVVREPCFPLRSLAKIRKQARPRHHPLAFVHLDLYLRRTNGDHVLVAAASASAAQVQQRSYPTAVEEVG